MGDAHLPSLRQSRGRNRPGDAASAAHGRDGDREFIAGVEDGAGILRIDRIADGNRTAVDHRHFRVDPEKRADLRGELLHGIRGHGDHDPIPQDDHPAVHEFAMAMVCAAARRAAESCLDGLDRLDGYGLPVRRQFYRPSRGNRRSHRRRGIRFLEGGVGRRDRGYRHCRATEPVRAPVASDRAKGNHPNARTVGRLGQYAGQLQGAQGHGARARVPENVRRQADGMAKVDAPASGQLAGARCRSGHSVCSSAGRRRLSRPDRLGPSRR